MTLSETSCLESWRFHRCSWSSGSAIGTGSFGFRHDWPEIVNKDDQGDSLWWSQKNALV